MFPTTSLETPADSSPLPRKTGATGSKSQTLLSKGSLQVGVSILHFTLLSSPLGDRRKRFPSLRIRQSSNWAVKGHMSFDFWVAVTISGHWGRKNPFYTWMITSYPMICLESFKGKLGAELSGATQHELPVAHTASAASVLSEPPKYGHFNGMSGGIFSNYFQASSKKHVIRAFVLTFHCRMTLTSQLGQTASFSTLLCHRDHLRLSSRASHMAQQEHVSRWNSPPSTLQGIQPGGNFWLAWVWPPGLQDHHPHTHGLKLSQGKLSLPASAMPCHAVLSPVHPRQQHASTHPHPSHHHPTASNTDVPFLFLHAPFPSDSKELSPLPMLSVDSIQHKALWGEMQILKLHQLLESSSLHKLRATSLDPFFPRGRISRKTLQEPLMQQLLAHGWLVTVGPGKSLWGAEPCDSWDNRGGSRAVRHRGAILCTGTAAPSPSPRAVGSHTCVGAQPPFCRTSPLPPLWAGR